MTKPMEEMTWVEFDEARKKIDTILIPTGSVEVEGPHLPLLNPPFSSFFKRGNSLLLPLRKGGWKGFSKG